MFKRVKRQKGMALVMAIMTAFILMALVTSLFWVISATQRQTEYARNGAIALNLAEAGVADALYRLNYCTGTTGSDNYPFFGTYIPFDLTSNDITLVSSLSELPPEPAGFSYTPSANKNGIKRNLGNGYSCCRNVGREC